MLFKVSVRIITNFVNISMGGFLTVEYTPGRGPDVGAVSMIPRSRREITFVDLLELSRLFT